MDEGEPEVGDDGAPDGLQLPDQGTGARARLRAAREEQRRRAEAVRSEQRQRPESAPAPGEPESRPPAPPRPAAGPPASEGPTSVRDPEATPPRLDLGLDPVTDDDEARDQLSLGALGRPFDVEAEADGEPAFGGLFDGVRDGSPGGGARAESTDPDGALSFEGLFDDLRPGSSPSAQPGTPTADAPMFSDFDDDRRSAAPPESAEPGPDAPIGVFDVEAGGSPDAADPARVEGAGPAAFAWPTDREEAAWKDFAPDASEDAPSPFESADEDVVASESESETVPESEAGSVPASFSAADSETGPAGSPTGPGGEPPTPPPPAGGDAESTGGEASPAAPAASAVVFDQEAADDAEDDDAEDAPRRRGRRVASPPEPPPTWRRVGFAAVLLVLIGLGGALAVYGALTVRDSTEGKVIDVTDDPTAPGFEAFVTPSPTMLVIHTADDGTAEGFTFLVLGPNDQGGAVIFLPVRTIAPLPQFGDQPISLAYEGGLAPVAAQVVQNLLGTGILEVVEVDDPRWTTLTEPLGPFTLDNPDDVVIDDPETGEVGLLFPGGELELPAVGVGQYLSERSEGESDLNRLVRNEIFWRTWLDAIAEDGTVDAVPGETETGLGRFARGLAAGPVEIVTLPVTEFDDPERGEVVYLPREAQIAELVAEVVALPTSPEPGARPKVRLLNGTTDREVLGSLRQPLVDAGAEISVIGNAASFDVATTQIVFSDPTFSDDVREYQDALGVGEIVREERPVENVDITIIVGADYTGGGS